MNTPKTDAIQYRVCKETDDLEMAGKPSQTEERLNDLLQEAYDHARQLETQVQELREALNAYAGSRIDLRDAPCHRGLTIPEKCGRCSRDIIAWNLLERTK